MTFEQQIEGVPMTLIQQGWRRAVSAEVRDRWLAGGPVLTRSWQADRVQCGDGQWLDICRPCKQVDGSTFDTHSHIYAHAGWGEGLQPTLETVKIWPFWWYKAASESRLYVVDVWLADDGLRLVSTRMHERRVAAAKGDWLGPVLPSWEVKS